MAEPTEQSSSSTVAIVSRYTPAQEARLKALAQLVATWIKRDIDAKLAASRRVK